MAIPDKPLVITRDQGSFTIGEQKKWSRSYIDKFGVDVYAFEQFLLSFTDWTEEDIDGITNDEIEQLMVKIGEAAKQRAVPLSNSTPSKTGRASRGKRSQTGLPS